jgi:hypothetical protein
MKGLIEPGRHESATGSRNDSFGDFCDFRAESRFSAIPAIKNPTCYCKVWMTNSGLIGQLNYFLPGNSKIDTL